MFENKIKRSNQKQAVALVMVIATLSMLILIAIPFVRSMRIEKRATSNQLSKVKAKLIAQGAFEYSLSQLSRSDDTLERYASQDKIFKTPGFDSTQESEVNFVFPNYRAKNPKGDLWSVEVEDEQGKIDLNSASPWLIGNLMASAICLRTVDKEGSIIRVDSTAHFPDEKGFLWVEGELIRYHSKRADSFHGCERGLYSSTSAFSKAKKITPGTLLLDARAYRICRYRTLARPFQTIEEVKKIADLSETHAIDASLYDRMQPFLTVYAKQEGRAWRHRQVILNDLPGEKEDESDVVSLADTTFYAEGMEVRIQEGQKEERALIRSKSARRIRLDRRLTKSFSQGQAFIEVKRPTPININSAPPRVLIAMFKGLKLGSSWIDSKEAAILTDAILRARQQGKAFSSFSDWGEFLQLLQKSLREDAVKDLSDAPALSDQKIDLILAASYSSTGLRKRFWGTKAASLSSLHAPPERVLADIVFHNFDTYTVKATGVTHNTSGVPLAQYQVQKTVQARPSEILRWSLQTQKDFAAHLQHSSSARIISWPRFIDQFRAFPENAPSDQTAISLDTFPLKFLLPSSSIFSFPHTHEGVLSTSKEAPSVIIPSSGVTASPGSISFWFKPTAIPGGRFSLFKMGEESGQNQIHCFYEGGSLFLQVADTTLEESFAELRASLPIDRNWLHISIAWYDTHWGGLALFVDGQPVGEFRYRVSDNIVRTRTTRSVQADDEVIFLENTNGFPSEGAILIGEEIIEYERKLGNRLAVRKSYSGFEMITQLGRGVRSSVATNHPSGAVVVPFGYSEELSQDVFPATKLKQDLAASSVFTRLSSSLDIQNVRIPVESTRKFPAEGYLALVNQQSFRIEKIRYRNLQGGAFINCERGQLGTTAAPLIPGAFVFPISVLVEDSTLYPESGLVQIEDEWIEYERKVDENLLVAGLFPEDIQNFRNSGVFAPLYRGARGTISSEHLGEEKVFPVFRTSLGKLGRFDQVTLVNGSNPQEKEALSINWSFGDLASFREDVSRLYRFADSPRILKFPSGELPDEITPAKFSQETPFLLDEIEFIPARGLRSNSLIAISDQEVSLNSARGFKRDGGLLKIGDEYLSYQAISGRSLQGIKRGALESEKGIYTRGDRVRPIFFLRHSVLRTSLSSGSPEIEVNRASFFPREGYLKCGSEIIGYTEKEGNLLRMPVGKSGHSLRGAFGSEISDHSGGEVITLFPARYWDRSIPRYEGNEQAWLSLSKEAPGAFWERVTWEEEVPSSRYLGIRVLARINEQPAWDEKPTNQAGGIFEFTSPKDPNLLNLRGDKLEIRVYFPYKKGAYERGYWKRKALLKSFYVSFRQKTHVYESQ